MLPSISARTRFQAWNKASRILVYDADSGTLQEGSNLLGLMRKFRSVHFPGDVAWLQGGIQCLWREHRHLVDENPPSDDEEESEGPSVLRARNLPQSAFQQSSTNMKLDTRNVRDSQPVQSGASQHDSSQRMTASNPFFDNIRQNMELSQGITERIPLRLSPSVASRVREIPFVWLRNIVRKAGHDEGTEALAMQFYKIELGEQRRLQGVMAHHSNQSDLKTSSAEKGKVPAAVTSDGIFPYSIIAGVEKGAKNRYASAILHAQISTYS
jgi:tyrosine-protein phosphatase 2/3